jgi:hypothetical protein
MQTSPWASARLGRVSLLLILSGAVAGLGCSSSSSQNPGQSTPDASPVRDASSADAPHTEAGTTDAAPMKDGGPADTSTSDGPEPLAFHCFATTDLPNPNPCPTPSGASGEASFCYRPQWAGATKVEVYGGFGQATDWTDPFLTLKNDGSGTFTGTTAVANGSYPYLYRVHGDDDGIIRPTQYMLDQSNAHFLPSPPGSPSYAAGSKAPRSVSELIVPQASQPVTTLKGIVMFAGQAQSCFSVDLEAGEVTEGGVAKQEHNTANITESASDGTFSFPVTSAPYQVVVRYPFTLAAGDAGYPDPSTTPSMGYARIMVTASGATTTLDPIDTYYPDYAKMAPTSGTATLPVTFTITLIPGSEAAWVAVISTDIAGNDPAYASKASSSTSVMWDGTLGGKAGMVTSGETYYWGAWQEKAPLEDGGPTWNEESLLFPIVFH